MTTKRKILYCPCCGAKTDIKVIKEGATEVALWNGEEVVLTGRTSDHGKIEILIKDTEYHWVHKMELSSVR